MIEYGLFSDEGCVERQFWSMQEAELAISTRYDPDDGLEALEMCGRHGGQPLYGCEVGRPDDQDKP